MKYETEQAKKALNDLAWACKNLTMSQQQALEIFTMLEDFAWTVSESVARDRESNNHNYHRIRADDAIKRVRQNIRLAPIDPVKDNAFDEAMKALGPMDIKWTNKGKKD